MNIFSLFLELLLATFEVPWAHLFLLPFYICLFLTIISVKKPSKGKWVTVFLLGITGLLSGLILMGIGSSFEAFFVGCSSSVLSGILLLIDFVLLALRGIHVDS